MTRPWPGHKLPQSRDLASKIRNKLTLVLNAIKMLLARPPRDQFQDDVGADGAVATCSSPPSPTVGGAGVGLWAGVHPTPTLQLPASKIKQTCQLSYPPGLPLYRLLNGRELNPTFQYNIGFILCGYTPRCRSPGS